MLRLSTPDPRSSPSCRCSRSSSRSPSPSPPLAMLVPAVRRMLGVIRSGQPAPGRTGNPAGSHRRRCSRRRSSTPGCSSGTWVGIMHWFVYAAFLFLSTAVLCGVLPALRAVVRLAAGRPLVSLRVVQRAHRPAQHGRHRLPDPLRQKHHPRSEGRGSRFFGSTFWQAYFVEALALLEGARDPLRARRGVEARRGRRSQPLPDRLVDRRRVLPQLDPRRSRTPSTRIAAFKIVAGDDLADGDRPQHHHGHRVAPLHRLAQHLVQARGRRQHGARRDEAADVRGQARHPRRHRRPRRGLGARRRQGRGLLVEGHPRLHDLHRVRPLPVAVPGLEHREAALAQAADHRAARPHVRQARRGRGPRRARRWSAPAPRASRPARGTDVLDYFYNPADGDFVIDEDVLWSCTSCGACVQQCPVDIEHVDHIMDMRRYQLLVESNFPAELNQLFKGLENKGNPWNMSASRPDGLGQGPRLRRAGRRGGPGVPRVGRLAVLGRVRGGVRGPREEDDPRGRRAARHRRHLLRRARQRRDLHR